MGRLIVEAIVFDSEVDSVDEATALDTAGDVAIPLLQNTHLPRVIWVINAGANGIYIKPTFGAKVLAVGDGMFLPPLGPGQAIMTMGTDTISYFGVVGASVLNITSLANS